MTSRTSARRRSQASGPVDNLGRKLAFGGEIYCMDIVPGPCFFDRQDAGAPAVTGAPAFQQCNHLWQ